MRERPQDMECSCRYNEWLIAESRQGVVLQLRIRAEIIPHSKQQNDMNHYTRSVVMKQSFVFREGKKTYGLRNIKLLSRTMFRDVSSVSVACLKLGTSSPNHFNRSTGSFKKKKKKKTRCKEYFFIQNNKGRNKWPLIIYNFGWNRRCYELLFRNNMMLKCIFSPETSFS